MFYQKFRVALAPVYRRQWPSMHWRLVHDL